MVSLQNDLSTKIVPRKIDHKWQSFTSFKMVHAIFTEKSVVMKENLRVRASTKLNILIK